MTKQQLIDIWLLKYPADTLHLDLEHNALAGHVLCKDGLYRDWVEYEFYRERV